MPIRTEGEKAAWEMLATMTKTAQELRHRASEIEHLAARLYTALQSEAAVTLPDPLPERLDS